jgi:hypothetical protein
MEATKALFGLLDEASNALSTAQKFSDFVRVEEAQGGSMQNVFRWLKLS